MDYDEQIAISKKREYLISKSNALIQRSRYELSVPEQRTVAYICSMIKPRSALDIANNAPYELIYEFDILEYTKVCEIEDNGRVYEEIKALLRGLIKKVYWITLPNGTETTVNWINKVWTNKRSGKVKIRLDEDMIPYLFDLKEKFTAYGLYNILKMKSQYSIRLYEILKSYEWQKSKTIEIDELKRMLMVENIKSYENFKDFRKKVLEIALDEINQYTDLKVGMETITKGKKVVKIKFRIMNERKELERKARIEREKKNART